MNQTTPPAEKTDSRDVEVQSWREAAEAGNADAVAELAFAHLRGYGVPKDPNKAVQLMQQAAEKGSMSAQVYLASVTFDAHNASEQEYAKARNYFRMAAEQGHAESGFRYAMYGHDLRGYAEYEHPSKFRNFLYRFKSLNFGDDGDLTYSKFAEMHLNDQYVVFDNWTKRIKQEDHETVAKLLHNSAEQGYVNAQYLLFLFYGANTWPYKNRKGDKENYWDMNDMWYFVASKGSDDHMFSPESLTKSKVGILSQDDAVIERVKQKAEEKYAEIEQRKKQQQAKPAEFIGPLTQLITTAKPGTDIVALSEKLVHQTDEEARKEDLPNTIHTAKSRLETVDSYILLFRANFWAGVTAGCLFVGYIVAGVINEGEAEEGFGAICLLAGGLSAFINARLKGRHAENLAEKQALEHELEASVNEFENSGGGDSKPAES